MQNVIAFLSLSVWCNKVSPFTAQFAGEDPVVALEAALQFEDTRESMQAFCVGQYMEVPTMTVTHFLNYFHSS